ncbi:MAG: PBP1A family penicillin-binding protein [Bryobacteraceae bacterium]|nr:PBP1A family penicillin-binding protein [Bryobacteraceae bacterium]
MPTFLRSLLSRMRGESKTNNLADSRQSASQPQKTWMGRHPYLTSALVVSGVLFLAVSALLLNLYTQYSRLITERLGSGSLRTSSAIYAAPKLIGPGESLTPVQLVAHLQRASYTEAADNKVGHYKATRDRVEITTGAESWFQPHADIIEFSRGQVSRIFSRTDNREVSQYWLEPELISNVLDAGRGKSRPVAFSEFPQHVIQALVSVEDKRFFNHSGLDLIRLGKAAYVDLKEGRKEQGASTLTMQLARSFWLDQDKNWRRKITEVIIAAELERRFTKEEIFQLYANEVYLGRRGSFSVHGFGEAAQAYFGKDLRKLTLPEAAMLSGIIQRPSYYNPFKYPDRVKQRRDIVLTLMHNNGYLDARQLAEHTATPIVLSPGETESSEAPYFIELVNDDLQEKFGDWDFARNAYRIYSTLDLDLQRAAFEAVQAGMAEVDKTVRRKQGSKFNGKLPQVALVVLDPHTGAIKALVGGRSYKDSQLNRVVSMRQPGSSFKPFVYAAALDAGSKKKSANIVTAASVFEDQPTTFIFNKQPYQPANFGDRYLGMVTVRKAMISSLNIPTIKVAEKVGFDNVVRLAQAAGIKAPLQGTPSLALGSYEVPPIEIAEAYTIFSNGGAHLKRYWMQSIRDRENKRVFVQQPEENQVIDERVAGIMTNILQDVVRYGTAAGVKSRGFSLPAAGKTGTARDGWFAGYTSKLLTVVWVGYDDYSDLDLEGSKSALPVWTEFMKRAHQFRQYRGAEEFKMPKGVVSASVDTMTGLVAGEDCLNVRGEYFVAGTVPKRCDSDHLFDEEGAPTETVRYEREEPKKSVFGRIGDIFR